MISEFMEKGMLIDSTLAVRIALEDPELLYFIRCHFALPEKSPKIFTRKWLSQGKRGCVWNVSIEEHLSFPFEKNMMNAAVISVDPVMGRIVSRRFFSRVFCEEYRKGVKSLRDPLSCKGRNR